MSLLSREGASSQTRRVEPASGKEAVIAVSKLIHVRFDANDPAPGRSWISCS